MCYRITILCENSVGSLSGTLGEHGFSALIEAPSREPVLFDTGQGHTILHNARRMNRDLSIVRKVVISHGHYDHAGGLVPLLLNCGPKEIYSHPGIFTHRFRVKDTGESIPIGISQSREELESLGARFDFSREFRELAPGIFLSGEVPRQTGFETGDVGMFLDSVGERHDTIDDDQSLYLLTKRGLVVLLGCCHAGLINTLRHAVEKTGESRIYAVIGGMHLGFCPPSQVETTITELKNMQVIKLCPSHCTGSQTTFRLWQEFQGSVTPASVGYSCEV